MTDDLKLYYRISNEAMDKRRWRGEPPYGWYPTPLRALKEALKDERFIIRWSQQKIRIYEKSIVQIRKDKKR